MIKSPYNLIMNSRQYHSDDPVVLSLSADARCGPTDYLNDQIWDLKLEGGEPPALALHTTYGLRAKMMRFFPRFLEGETEVIDPQTFSTPPIVLNVFPNYISLSCAPFTGIDVIIEYWVPESHAIAGRISFSNTRLSDRHIQFNWVAILRPTGDGEIMKADEKNAVTVLTGRTDGLAPLLFMTSGPKASSGPYPALSLDLDLPPGGSRQIIWSHTALSDTEASFDLARRIVAHNWDAEIARIEMLNAAQIEIETGDPDWDAVFAMTQKTAYELFVGPTSHLPSASIVLSRHPDQGFSHREDGSDYSTTWNGQTPLDSYFIAGQILPSNPQLAIGLLNNFLSTQKQNGYIDWKPGLGGQRSKLLATPILVSLAWRIYETTEDDDFLRDVFPKLLAFLQHWFDPKQDRDGDGIPEWEHSVQSGFELQSDINFGGPWTMGPDINYIESPALCALLYQECTTIIKIAKLLEITHPLPALQSLADNLRTATEAAWDDNAFIYHYWDRDTHFNPHGHSVGERTGSGEINLEEKFDNPVRLLVSINPNDEIPRTANIFLHGSDSSRNHIVEKLAQDRIRWSLDEGTIISRRVYRQLERIEIFNLNNDDKATVRIVDFSSQDQSLLLPLWACIPNQERADLLVEKTILDISRFWRPFGIPSRYLNTKSPNTIPPTYIQIPWNSMIGMGMLAYGYRDEAAELVSRLMAAIIQNLKRDHAFRQNYHSETAIGLGERNALGGLAPLRLFLETLGVRLISRERVHIEGYNPFPWTVTIKYRGLSITREKQKTTVVVPGGQRAVVRSPEPRIITLESVK
jgi:hypothetical protein